jgi:beta-aspartyl-peptidase (threonine type)
MHEVFGKKSIPGDTVGAVAMDNQGNLASGTSTGGVPNKHPGRVGDSPLIGCGTYADNEYGAVSTSGWGEAMIRTVMAKTVVDLIPRVGNDPLNASREGLRILKRKTKGVGGIIAMNPKGDVGIAYNTPRMARGYLTSSMAAPIFEV